MPGPVDREKRRTPRIQPFLARCKVIDGERTLSAYLTDISTQGARVSSNSSLSPGTQTVLIEVRFGRRASASRLPARVQWSTPGRKQGEAAVFGVAFFGLDGEGEALLEWVVREFRRRASQLA